jgi:hypothetical protein
LYFAEYGELILTEDFVYITISVDTPNVSNYYNTNTKISDVKFFESKANGSYNGIQDYSRRNV